MWAAGKGSLIVFCQQIPLRRLSADQHRCDHLVYRFADRCVFAVFMFFNLLHQKFHRFSSEHIDLLSYGADREDGVSGGGRRSRRSGSLQGVYRIFVPAG